MTDPNYGAQFYFHKTHKWTGKYFGQSKMCN